MGGALPSFLVMPFIVLLHALNVKSGMLSDILFSRSLTGDLSVLNKLIPALNATISISKISPLLLIPRAKFAATLRAFVNVAVSPSLTCIARRLTPSSLCPAISCVDAIGNSKEPKINSLRFILYSPSLIIEYHIQ